LIQELGHCLPEDVDWIAWNSLFRRSWFTRTWILQEASLAKRLILLSGKRRFDFDDINYFDLYYGIAPWWPMRAPNHTGELLAPEILIPIINTRDTIKQGSIHGLIEDLHGAFNQGAVLLAILIRARGSQASNPLDKVYGTIGIVRRLLGAKFDEEVIPHNYGVSTSELCIRVATYILTTVPILSLLSHAEEAAEQGSRSLPSWVPNFSVKHTAGTAQFGNISKDYIPSYKACLTHSDLLATRSVEGNTLFVNGHHLGSIFEIVIGSPHNFSADQLTNQLKLLSKLPTTYLNGQSKFEVFWRTASEDIFPGDPENLIRIPGSFIAFIIRTLLNEQDYNSQGMSQRLETAFKQLADLDCNFKQHLKSFHIPALDLLPRDIPAFVSRCTDAKFRNDIWDELARHRELFLNITESVSRTLFRTENEYLGIGSRAYQTCDQVWLLEQARVPFILRPIPDTDYYQLIGECYAHGVMQGELVGSIDFVKIGLA